MKLKDKKNSSLIHNHDRIFFSIVCIHNVQFKLIENLFLKTFLCTSHNFYSLFVDRANEQNNSWVCKRALARYEFDWKFQVVASRIWSNHFVRAFHSHSLCARRVCVFLLSLSQNTQTVMYFW